MKSKIVLAATLALVCSASSFASVEGAARHTAFKKIQHDMRIIGPMVKGQIAYDKNTLSSAAADLKLISREPFRHFDSQSSAAGTDAKAAIWSRPDDFAHDRDHFYAAADALSVAASSGDLAQVRKSFTPLVQSCKTCHDSFRR
jgi:cytochrome c556